ncbi:MAG: ABC transporter ATP-binding protein, partial [Alphaproteobacteria bacterium]
MSAAGAVAREEPVAGGMPLLSVRGLELHIPSSPQPLRVVDGVSFDLRRGETLGLVGESGSGKTLTALSIMRLLEPPLSGFARGAVSLDGVDLMGLTEREMSALRGRWLSMIFQEPMTSLNPVMTAGRQIAEPAIRHLGLGAAEATARAEEMLRLVGIPDPARVAASHPHLLSGGMRQRAMIAMAIACRPALLVADEPTTALDVTVQAQILELLGDLQRELGSAILLITHDLAVIAENAHRVAVMYAGRIVEEAPVDVLFSGARHPYARGLLASIPRIERSRPDVLPEIPGVVPAPGERPPGCALAPPCARARAMASGLMSHPWPRLALMLSQRAAKALAMMPWYIVAVRCGSITPSARASAS